MKKFILKAITSLIIVLIFFSAAQYTYATYSYTYSTSKGVVSSEHTPVPYLVDKVLDGNSVGYNFSSPKDMKFDSIGNLYIVDSGTDSIIILNSSYEFKQIISGFVNNNVTDKFASPHGIFISDIGDIYICDTENARIVVLDAELELKNIIESPESEILSSDFRFRPVKLTVDNAGNMYVISRNEYQGMLKFDPHGNFMSFFGSNRVVFDPIEMIWRRIMTREQRDRMIQFLPIEYTNLFTDHEGFIYAVSASGALSDPLKRMNLSGEDVILREGYVPLTGDAVEQGEYITSIFVDVVSNVQGTAFVLDSAMGRIFAYNSEGYLLYAFGGIGNRAGFFQSPVAIEYHMGKLFVLDETLSRITVFEETEFASGISDAEMLYNSGMYDESVEKWYEVLKMNSNYELAYAQIGKVYLRENRFRKAMDYLQLGNFRGSDITFSNGYNKALYEHRKNLLKNNFGFIFVAILLIIAAWIYIKSVIKKRKVFNTGPVIDSYLFSFKILTSPFESFWDMKYEKKGKMYVALTIVGFYIFNELFTAQVTGFLFNPNKFVTVNAIFEIQKVLIFMLVFCIGNWSITSLLDGEGKFRETVMVFGYACLPIPLIQIPVAIISNGATFMESAYISGAITFSWAAFFILLFIGIMTINRYSFTKMLLVIFLTIFAMAAMIFVYLVFLNIIVQLIAFIGSIYKEITFRL